MTLLTIAIPTFNRAKIVLEKAQLLNEIFLKNNYYQKCEFIIVDNASSDNTYEQLFSFSQECNRQIKIYKNKTNLGLVGNCLKCIDLAAGKYVWLIGDDDHLEDGIFQMIVRILEDSISDINLVHLNHKCIDKTNGPIILNSFYLNTPSEFTLNGTSLYNKLIFHNHTGGFMFISANIMLRSNALKVIAEADFVSKNYLGFPMFLNSSLALTGPLYFISEIGLTCVYNQSSWIDKYLHLNIIELPTFWIKLLRIGLSKANFKNLILHHSYILKKGYLLSLLKHHQEIFNNLFYNIYIIYLYCKLRIKIKYLTIS